MTARLRRRATVMEAAVEEGPFVSFTDLTIGILFGIYSSVFVAAAIAMWLGVKREDLVKSGGTQKAGGGPDDPNAGAVV